MGPGARMLGEMEAYRAECSSEPGCSHHQKQPSPDDDASDGSSDALTGRCEMFDSDG